MRRQLTVVMLLALTAGTLQAQGGRGGGRVGPPPGPPPGGDTAAPNRAQLEQQVRQRLGQVMKNRLGLNDEQMNKLQETNRKFDERRRILVDQERDIRMSLRDEMLRPDSGRQPQVSALLERMVKAQRQRVDVLEQEQAELGKFLTPLQRAKYFAAEELVRQQMQNMRQQQMGRGAGRGGPGMGPGGGMGPGPGAAQPALQGRGLAQCAQMTPQQRQRLLQRRARGQTIPPGLAPCLPPGEGPIADPPPAF